MYVAILAAKLVRLERQTAELLELAQRRESGSRAEEPEPVRDDEMIDRMHLYAARVAQAPKGIRSA